MHIMLACSGMMAEFYEMLRERFVKTKQLKELRSYCELRYFTGHTLPVFGDPFFLDSGAFSAWSQGFAIEPAVYAEFLKRYGLQMTYYANLDAIPKARTPEAAAQAAEETLNNQKYLEDQGLHPLPVFHKGEPFRYLEYYLSKGYPYLCLGGLVGDASLGSNEEFFDYVWEHYLSNDDGTAKLKVHAFGCTNLAYMTGYPWFSVDSSSWLIQAKTGFIAIPTMTNGKYDYNKRPILVSVSEKSPSQKWEGWHFLTLKPEQKKQVMRYIEEQQLDVNGLMTEPVWRFAANWRFWIDLNNNATFTTKFLKRQHEFF